VVWQVSASFPTNPEFPGIRPGTGVDRLHTPHPWKKGARLASEPCRPVDPGP